ncbi:hypothetical protein [Moraxella oblonga]|uniref:hypothetical protein n=1 Tax=Moraxella oblonga TaxID=200413 RepID=UPI000836632F|nr:hypothetical protein [Moraxella oblonga]
MFELLTILVALVHFIGIIGFLTPLMAIWFAIDHVKMNKAGLVGVGLGFVIAVVVSSVMYLSVATISHNFFEFYSHYGSKFSEFYSQYLLNTAIVVNVVLMLLWFDKTFINNKNFTWTLLMSYQVSLFFLLIFNPLLVLVLEKCGVIDVAIGHFAKSLRILSSDVDIRNDLIHPKLSRQSYMQMGVFFFFNQLLVILMAIRHRRTAKHQPKSD